MSTPGPEPDQLVGLKLSPSTRIPARVLAAGPGLAILSLTMRPETPLEALVGHEAAIEYVGEKGVYLVTGSIKSTGPGEDTVNVALAEEPTLIQRRAHVRVDVMIPVAIRSGGQGSLWAHTVTLNLSGGGFLIGGPESLRAGTNIDFRLSPGEDRARIEGRGRVVRDLPKGHRAIEIEEIDRNDQELLIRFLFERQRAAAWVARKR